MKKIFLAILIGLLIINLRIHSQNLSPLDSLDIYNPFTQSDQLRRIIKTRLSILSGENKTLINKYAIQIENARKSNSKLDEAEASVNTGYIYFKSALYNLALDYYMRALDIYEEKKETTKAAIVEIDIGRTYYFADLVSDSKEYFTNAYRKLVKTNNEELIAYANYAMGIIVDNPARREAHFKKITGNSKKSNQN